jgi:hypothetical protein
MPEIKEIRIRDLDVPKIPDWLMQSPQAIPPVVPATQNIGTPIVNLPGCVESHPDAGKSKTLAQDDENGTVTYCDATIPSFNPIDYSPENMTITTTAPPPKVDPPQAPEVPKTPEVPSTPVSTAKVDCPTPAQEAKEPVGTMVEGFRKKVVEYKLMGNECVQITEPVPLPQQIISGLPSGGQVVQVGGVAVVATASALLAKPLADILLKAVKPTIKKVMKKIAAIRKKPIPVQSVGDRRAEQRQMNHAVRELRSVFPRRKKKRKG